MFAVLFDGQKKAARWRRMERAKQFKGQRTENKNEISAGQKKKKRSCSDIKTLQTAKTLSGTARSYRTKRKKKN